VVRWEKGDTEPPDDYTIYYGNWSDGHYLVTGSSYIKGNTSAVERVESVRDRMSYITPRCRWCDISVLNVHAPNENKSDDRKQSVFHQFRKYHMKILLRNFNAKVVREDVVKRKFMKHSLHERVMIMGLD
jgi:hypothetical protein